MTNETKKMVINGIINAIANMSITDIMVLDSMVDAIVIKAIMPKTPVNSVNDIPNIDGYIKLAKAIVGDCGDVCPDNDEREDMLDEREREIIAREDELNARERDLNDREDGLDTREEELDAREDELDGREHELNQRELEMNCAEDPIEVDYDDDDDYDGEDEDVPCAHNGTFNTTDARNAIVGLIGQIANMLK